jgi:predicted amidohydrolase
MKIAVAQISCSLGDLKANLLKIRDFSTQAKETGVDLIVFPEMTDIGYSMPVIQTHATPWTNGFVSQLQGIAAELSIAIVAGVSERDGALIYNSQVLSIDRVKSLTKYRKTHLFASAPIAEHKCFSPGDRLSSFAFAGLRFGAQHLLRPSISRAIPKARGGKQCQLFHRFFCLAFSAL